MRVRVGQMWHFARGERNVNNFATRPEIRLTRASFLLMLGSIAVCTDQVNGHLRVNKLFTSRPLQLRYIVQGWPT